MTGRVRRSWWRWVALVVAPAGCVEVHAGTDCLTVTEVSSARPGRVAFDRDSCQPLPSGCPGDQSLTDDYCTCPKKMNDEVQADWYCPDYVELCNRTELEFLDPSSYQVANHLWLSQPNPWAPGLEPVGRGQGPIVGPGECAVFPLEPHEDDDDARSALCATETGLEMETSARLTIIANVRDRHVCEFDFELGSTELATERVDDWHDIWQLPHNGEGRFLGEPTPLIDSEFSP